MIENIVNSRFINWDPPAPSESTTSVGGFDDAAKYTSDSLSIAIAPSAPHGHINFALQNQNKLLKNA